MLLLLSLVCVFSCFGGILLGQSLKGLLFFTQGLEKGQKKLFSIGVASVILAIVLSVASIFLPGCGIHGNAMCVRPGVHAGN